MALMYILPTVVGIDLLRIGVCNRLIAIARCDSLVELCDLLPDVICLLRLNYIVSAQMNALENQNYDQT